jgi:hypothetical protein
MSDPTPESAPESLAERFKRAMNAFRPSMAIVDRIEATSNFNCLCHDNAPAILAALAAADSAAADADTAEYFEPRSNPAPAETVAGRTGAATVAERLEHAIATASNDDTSAIGSSERARHIERIEAMRDAVTALRTPSPGYEAGRAAGLRKMILFADGLYAGTRDPRDQVLAMIVERAESLIGPAPHPSPLTRSG